MDNRFSYTYGYILFSTIQQQSFTPMNNKYFARGALDAGSGTGFFTQDEMTKILHEVQTKMLEQAQAELEALAKTNLTAAEDFLKVNKTKANVVTTDSGLQYQVIRPGKGISPTKDDIVDIDYKIMLLDGTVLDSSYDRGVSSSFQLKEIGVDGFIEGVQKMMIGASYRFWIHPSLAYGEEGNQTIDPNSLLIVEVELKSVKKNSTNLQVNINTSLLPADSVSQ
jgi:FKBP-type peptidyl-prolyl cis-trans isomerase